MAEGDVAKALTMKGLADAWAKEGLGLVGKALMAPINAGQDIMQNYRPGPQNEVVNQDIGRQGFDAATAAMAGAPFAEAGAVGAMGGKPPRLNWDTPLPTRVENPIKAYHGSPYDFERFDPSKRLTGEGANAYGPGTYFAENESVARSYKPDSDLNLAANRALNPFYEPATNGRMYEVNLHATPEQFLDWDKPLTQQSDNVRKALRDAGFTQEALDYRPPWPKSILQAEPPGSSAYYALAKKMEPDMAAQLLSQHGIPGIRYADQWTRDALNQRGVLGQGKGTHNYVVFPGSEHIIEIMRKYGVTAPVAAYMLSQQSGDQQ